MPPVPVKAMLKPASKWVNNASVKLAGKPVVKPVAKPLAKSVVKPVVKPGVKPVVKAAVKSAVQAAGKRIPVKAVRSK